jgi:hypothetical protein
MALFIPPPSFIVKCISLGSGKFLYAQMIADEKIQMSADSLGYL